jgi:hypothetical protein
MGQLYSIDDLKVLLYQIQGIEICANVTVLPVVGYERGNLIPSLTRFVWVMTELGKGSVVLVAEMVRNRSH